MKRTLFIITAALLILPSVFGALLSPSEAAVAGFASTNLSDSLMEMVDAWYANGNVTRIVNGNLVVPWYSADNVCGEGNLQSGGNCNIGTVNHSQYCMVSDELSQVGIILSMGDNQTLFDQYFNTLNVIVANASEGQLPAWRVLVNETTATLHPADARTNGNADTASDATARIITSLFTAANNTRFTDSAQQALYYALAVNLTDDMITNEYDNTCHNISVLGVTEACYWLKAGTKATLTNTDGAYTGYYQDAIIALLQACSHTKNLTYCGIARNTTLNYMQAAYPYDNATTSFRVPPGRSYKWDFTGDAFPVCTNTCSPVQWDTADAPRAFGLGMSVYYAELMNLGAYVPGLRDYVVLWTTQYMKVADSLPIQYSPDGANTSTNQSGYKAQGWQAQALLANTSVAFNATVRDAIDHYDQTPVTWDYAACAGVYGQSFSVRALGAGIGLDEAAYPLYTPVAAPVAASGLTGACADINSMYANVIGFGPVVGTLLGVSVLILLAVVLFGIGFSVDFDPMKLATGSLAAFMVGLILVVGVIVVNALC